ncbi:hypothetical protein C2E23DRAFT_808300, partial [Lenzites betulinus]
MRPRHAVSITSTSRARTRPVESCSSSLARRCVRPCAEPARAPDPPVRIASASSRHGACVAAGGARSSRVAPFSVAPRVRTRSADDLSLLCVQAYSYRGHTDLPDAALCVALPPTCVPRRGSDCARKKCIDPWHWPGQQRTECGGPCKRNLYHNRAE